MALCMLLGQQATRERAVLGTGEGACIHLPVLRRPGQKSWWLPEEADWAAGPSAPSLPDNRAPVAPIDKRALTHPPTNSTRPPPTPLQDFKAFAAASPGVFEQLAVPQEAALSKMRLLALMGLCHGAAEVTFDQIQVRRLFCAAHLSHCSGCCFCRCLVWK